MGELPENLRAELDGWGFRSARRDEGTLAVSKDGSLLAYRDEYDGEEYVLAESAYDVSETEGTTRPFLATVLDVLRWAATQIDAVPAPAEEPKEKR